MRGDPDPVGALGAGCGSSRLTVDASYTPQWTYAKIRLKATNTDHKMRNFILQYGWCM